MDLSVSPNLDEFCSTFMRFLALKLRCAEKKPLFWTHPPTEEGDFVSSVGVAPVLKGSAPFLSSSSQSTFILKSRAQSSVGHRHVWGS